jgi:hypothetical protein
MSVKKRVIRIPQRWQAGLDLFVAIETVYRAGLKGHPQAEWVLASTGRTLANKLAHLRHRQMTSPRPIARMVHQTAKLNRAELFEKADQIFEQYFGYAPAASTPTPAQIQAWFDLPSDPRQAEGSPAEG